MLTALLDRLSLIESLNELLVRFVALLFVASRLFKSGLRLLSEFVLDNSDSSPIDVR